MAANRPPNFDKTLPFESWDGFYIQMGVRFDKFTLQPVSPGEPVPFRPAKLDPRERRTEFLWKGRYVYVQNGWAFDPATRLAIKE